VVLERLGEEGAAVAGGTQHGGLLLHRALVVFCSNQKEDTCTSTHHEAGGRTHRAIIRVHFTLFQLR
jgi:hypothetical protein